MHCNKLGSMQVTSAVLQVPKHLFITCKRALLCGRRMSGPQTLSTRPVVLLRYRYIVTIAQDYSTCFKSRSMTLAKESGSTFEYKLKGFIVSIESPYIIAGPGI